MSSSSCSTRRARSTTIDTLVGQSATLAIDQDHAQLLLESGDVAADVGLHGVQRSGGRGERAVVGDRHERGELAEIHLEK